MSLNGSGQNSKPLVSVVIPTYNRSEILRECLSALASQNFPFGSFEIIVVDDGSSDNTAEVVEQVRSPVEIRYYHQNNSGPAAARNRGVEHARSELILIMNDDAIATGNLVAGHYYMHRKMKNERLAVLGTREFRNEDKVKTLNFLYDQTPFSMRVHSLKEGFYPAPYFVTFNISMKKKDVQAIGGFDEDFATAIGEDTEFGVRWENSGGLIFFLPQLRCHHIHDVSVEGLKSQIIRENYNTLIMIYKQRPFCKPVEVFRQTESEMREYVEKYGPAMQHFEADLRQCENLPIWELEGREWLGDWVKSITDFVLRVRSVYLIYRSYVTLERYLTDPEARAFVQKWGGPNNTDDFDAAGWDLAENTIPGSAGMAGANPVK
jgi:glycosyltransferase involved in cell wall biosynthesis